MRNISNSKKLIKDFSSPIFDFRWQRCVDGYEIVELPGYLSGGVSKDIPILGDDIWTMPKRFIRPKTDNIETYFPFKINEGIAHRISDLKSENWLNEERALLFASEFGMLGLSTIHFESASYQEPLDLWLETATRFQRICKILESDKATKDPEAYTWYNDPKLPFSLKPRLSSEPQKSLRLLQFVPENLMTAAWVMLAEELTAGVGAVRCQNPKCYKWTPRRKNKLYCSSTCRVAGNRGKKLRSIN